MQPKLWILAFAAAFALGACTQGGGTFGGPGIGEDPSEEEDLNQDASPS